MSRGRGSARSNLNYPPSPLLTFALLPFDRRSPPLEQIYFSSQASAAVRIKDDNYNFHHENTEPSLAEITTPAMHALRMYSLSIVLNQSSPVFLHLHLTLSGCSEGAEDMLWRDNWTRFNRIDFNWLIMFFYDVWFSWSDHQNKLRGNWEIIHGSPH